MGEIDDCLNHDVGGPVGAKPADERPVDLQGVGRQLMQIAQRGETGTKIVEMDLDLDPPEALERGQCRLGVV